MIVQLLINNDLTTDIYEYEFNTEINRIIIDQSRFYKSEMVYIFDKNEKQIFADKFNIKYDQVLFGVMN